MNTRKIRLSHRIVMMSFPYRAILALVVFTAVTTETNAGEKRYLGGKWPAEKRTSIDDVDHSTWHQLLQVYVDANGNVNYSEWQKNTNHVKALDQYLTGLSRVSLAEKSKRADQLAFWINAYNAVTVRGILQVYPTKSIRDHTARLYGYNIWHDLLLVVGDEGVSLDQIEHKILRKMGEPRIHFAIVCASKSCPKLRNEAYLPDKLEDQLASNTKAFFAQPSNFRFSRGQFQVSSIMKWFASDFGSNTAAQLKYIAPYISDSQARSSAAAGRGSVGYISYDWGLNEQ